MNTKPSFTERIDALKRVARMLHDLSTQIVDRPAGARAGVFQSAEAVMSEVLHMEAASKRFEDRKSQYPRRATTKASR
jgi:hypothetical protein